VLFSVEFLSMELWKANHPRVWVGLAGITGIRDRDRDFGLSSHFFDDGNMAGIGPDMLGSRFP